MKLRNSLLALALVAGAGPALAAGDDAVLDTYWDMYNSVYVVGDIFALGIVDVSSSSSALVDQDQTTFANASVGDGDNTASASDDAGSDAEGNIGINIAAGVGNAQANDGALSSIDDDSDEVHASAQVFNSQATFGNLGDDDGDADNQLFYDASVGDNVLSNASGNIGLNVAAGVGNAQTNALAASVNSSGTLATASADSEQFTLINTLLADVDLDNTATLSGSALSGAVGNIGVNIAAGVGNAQHNGLAIAVASCGLCGAPPPPPPPCGGCGPGD